VKHTLLLSAAIVAAIVTAAPTPMAHAADDLLGMYQGYSADSQVGVDQPHRSLSELADWISDTTANALLYVPGKTSQKLAAIRPLFSEQGYKAYTDFLAAQGYGQSAQAQTLSMSTIVNNAPLLIGQGASAGRYAWAFEVPVVMTTSTDPRVAPNSRKVVLRIQFGRSPQGAPPHGLLIENWQVFDETAPQGNAAQGGGQPAGTP